MIRPINAVLDELGDDPSTLAAEIVRLRLEVAELGFEISRLAAARPVFTGPASEPSVHPTVRWWFGDPIPPPEGGDAPRRRIGYIR